MNIKEITVKIIGPEEQVKKTLAWLNAGKKTTNLDAVYLLEDKKTATIEQP